MQPKWCRVFPQEQELNSPLFAYGKTRVKYRNLLLFFRLHFVTQ